ncbi:uncharacterized protein LOC122057699 [Macadamia integrifolia]|uniref:uncharacterized protein LOC122057699 n=1 Tax=Macadamia integrifolia TaxID=60698 RepID=UPI001C52BA09|nr:uncharacterized protein LOC122057699 [Macadamia integrifolia]XP_042475840.1 uncharacterized protein LOC122057699 [Macadamia integrifolia]
MGKKQLRREYSSMSFSNRGCMSGIFHILYPHQWHNVKRMLPHKRHSAGRQPEGLESSKVDRNIPNTIEAQESIDGEVDRLLFDKKITETRTTNKKSGKHHIKTLIAEEMSEEDDQKRRTKVFPAQVRLLRTDSIHHLEPSDDRFFKDMTEKGNSPRIGHCQYNVRNTGVSKLVPVMPEPPETDASSKKCEVCGTMNAESNMGHAQVDELRRQLIQNHPLLWDKLDKGLSKQKYRDARDLIREDSLPQSKEFLNVLDVFQVNKELFMKILQDPDSSPADEFQNVQISNAERELTKSSSFPVAYLSYNNNVRPSNLKNNLRKIKSFTKREGQLQDGSSVIDSSDDIITGLMADRNKQEKVGTAEPSKDSDYSLGSSQALKNQGHNPGVTTRFKNIKQRIKHATEGSGKEHHRISMDATLHKITYGQKHTKDGKKEMSYNWKKPPTDTDFKDSPSSYGRDSSLYALGNGGLHRLRRTTSLKESLDRYSQLFESTFSRESKEHQTDRVRLTIEDVGSSCGPAPKTFGRLLSLPELESFCSLQSESDNSCLGMSTSIHVDNPANMERSGSDQQMLADPTICAENDCELEASVENVTQEILVEVSGSILIQGNEVGLILNADDDRKVDEMSGNLDNQPMLENSSTSQHQQEIELATVACVKQMQTSPNSVLDCHLSEFFITEEADSELNNELEDSLVNLPYGNGVITKIENVTILSKHFDSSDLPLVQVDKKDESDFNFVRDVLKLSGFSGNDKLRTWHLPEPPIDPSLFEEVDCCIQETGCNCDHQVLFDITNEVLVDIYERSFMYWPRPLYTNLSIRPLPIGFHVLEEVWASISWFLRYQPESDLSLDYIASRDLAKADGWMNLQFESECAGLEVEEWIWDDLLDEVLLELEEV